MNTNGDRQKELNFDFNYKFESKKVQSFKKEKKESLISKMMNKFIPFLAFGSLTVLGLNDYFIHIQKGILLTGIEILFYITTSIFLVKNVVIGKSVVLSIFKSAILLMSGFLIEKELKKYGIQERHIFTTIINMLIVTGGLGILFSHPAWPWNADAH